MTTLPAHFLFLPDEIGYGCIVRRHSRLRAVLAVALLVPVAVWFVVVLLIGLVALLPVILVLVVIDAWTLADRRGGGG